MGTPADELHAAADARSIPLEELAALAAETRHIFSDGASQKSVGLYQQLDGLRQKVANAEELQKVGFPHFKAHAQAYQTLGKAIAYADMQLQKHTALAYMEMDRAIKEHDLEKAQHVLEREQGLAEIYPAALDRLEAMLHSCVENVHASTAGYSETHLRDRLDTLESTVHDLWKTYDTLSARASRGSSRRNAAELATNAAAVSDATLAAVREVEYHNLGTLYDRAETIAKEASHLEHQAGQLKKQAGSHWRSQMLWYAAQITSAVLLAMGSFELYEKYVDTAQTIKYVDEGREIMIEVDNGKLRELYRQPTSLTDGVYEVAQ